MTPSGLRGANAQVGEAFALRETPLWIFPQTLHSMLAFSGTPAHSVFLQLHALACMRYDCRLRQSRRGRRALGRRCPRTRRSSRSRFRGLDLWGEAAQDRHCNRRRSVFSKQSCNRQTPFELMPSAEPLFKARGRGRSG